MPKLKPRSNRVHGLRLPTKRSLSAEIKTILNRCQEKIGFVPNVLRSYTLRPKKFGFFRDYNNELMLGESGLTKLEREVIAVVVSSANHCHYCIIAHAAAVRHLSGDEEFGDTLAINYRSANMNSKLRKICDFSWKITTEPHKIGTADRLLLKRSGCSDEDIFDIVEVASFYNMSNRVASGLSIQPNKEYYSIGRDSK